jgi:hypothetical protein
MLLTDKEMEKLKEKMIGKTVKCQLNPNNKALFDCKIIDVRQIFGRIEYLVEPTGGRIWVQKIK